MVSRIRTSSSSRSTVSAMLLATIGGDDDLLAIQTNPPIPPMRSRQRGCGCGCRSRPASARCAPSSWEPRRWCSRRIGSSASCATSHNPFDAEGAPHVQSITIDRALSMRRRRPPRRLSPVQLPARGGCGRGGVCRPDPRDAGPAGVSPARRQANWPNCRQFYVEGRTDGSFDTGIRVRAPRRCWQVPPSSSARAAAVECPGRCPRIESPTSSWRRVSRSSCGAVFPTRRC